MKYSFMVGVIALTVVSINAKAATCDTFPVSGKYVNVKDAGQGQVKLKLSSDCQKITLSDNGGNDWIIDLSGKSTGLPAQAAQMVGDNVSNATYSAKLVSPGHIQITARGNVILTGSSNALRISTQVEYIADAYVITQGSGRSNVQLESQSLRLLSVNANGVVNGETSGFVQGANLILDIAKSMLDARLLPL